MEETLLVNDAAEVRKTIARYMLADAMDLVFDLEKSHGSRLYDSKSGRFFLDFFGCYATIAIGYNHPHLTSPAALRTLAHASVQKPSNSDVYTREMADFVETFGRLAKPDFMKYLFFIEGGALAVENALKAAFDWKVRKNFAKGIEQEKGYKVIHFRQAFHGRSGYTLSLTNTFDPRKTQYFPKFDWPRVTNPKCAFPLEGENLRKVELLEREAFSQIEEAIRRDPAGVSCILLEPIQAEGGDNYFRPEFHRALRKICDENELLLIHDEVQTGFGVTGRMWACEHYVKPDLIAFGKKSQVCGVMAGERLDEVAENVFHVSSRINSTWGGNLVDMVRCRLNLEVYEQEGLLDYVARAGARLLGELRALEREFAGKVSNARGLGLFCAFDLASREMRDQFRRSCFENQLIILGCGEQTVRFRTALSIPESDLAQGIDIIRKVLRGL